MTLEPRSLQLKSLGELRTELHRLLNSGYKPAGKWNLAQTCRHLECWMTFPVDGFPKQGIGIRMLMNVLRTTMGKSMFRKILAQGSMKAGGPTMPPTVFQPDCCHEKEAVERLERAIDNLERHSGPIHDSPLFGSMNRDECLKLQLIHCAHHLSRLIPQENVAT